MDKTNNGSFNDNNKITPIALKDSDERLKSTQRIFTNLCNEIVKQTYENINEFKKDEPDFKMVPEFHFMYLITAEMLRQALVMAEVSQDKATTNELVALSAEANSKCLLRDINEAKIKLDKILNTNDMKCEESLRLRFLPQKQNNGLEISKIAAFQMIEEIINNIDQNSEKESIAEDLMVFVLISCAMGILAKYPPLPPDNNKLSNKIIKIKKETHKDILNILDIIKYMSEEISKTGKNVKIEFK